MIEEGRKHLLHPEEKHRNSFLLHLRKHKMNERWYSTLLISLLILFFMSPVRKKTVCNYCCSVLSGRGDYFNLFDQNQNNVTKCYNTPANYIHIQTA